MALNELLSGLTRSEFFERHFLKTPFALASTCSNFVPLGSRLIANQLLSQAGVDVIAAGPIGARRLCTPLRPEEITASLAAGESLGIRHAHLHEAGLANLADQFACDFLAPADVHLYWTPAACPGFGWHYDAEDVFVLQTSGTKLRELRKNTVNPWPPLEALPDDMQAEREIMPVIRCRLEAGDWLYIPHGYWHRTQAMTESISLSVGLAMPTGLNLIDFLRPLLVDSMRWRQRMLLTSDATFAGAEGEPSLSEHFQALGQDIARILANPQMLADFQQHWQDLTNSRPAAAF